MGPLLFNDGLPGITMTNEGLRKIEVALGVQLPEEYRVAVTPADPGHLEYFSVGALYNQPETIIEETRRLAGITKSFDDPWDEKWVAISEVNGGDGVLLDTGRSDALLLLWDHETSLVEPFRTT